MNDFITRRLDTTLSPLRLTDISVEEFLAKLADYLSVLNDGGSIAFGRGEDLTSIRLGKSLESVFSIATPCVKAGPPLSWATIVLFAGPQFEGPSQFRVGESSIEMSENDLELLRSGRPWRFLCPWPDRNDCKKELLSSELVLQELTDIRKTMHEVLEQISLVEQSLRNHCGSVSQLCQEKLGTAGLSTDLDEDTTQHQTSTWRSIGRNISSTNCTPCSGDSPSSLNNDQCPGNNSTMHLVIRNEGDQDTAANGGSKQDMQPGELPSVNETDDGKKLHSSDFIQSLSDILDDPANQKALRWSEDGLSVLFSQESAFPPHLLTQLSTKSYQSLIRRLYYYGFHKIGSAYRHNLFIRGQPSSIQPAPRTSHSSSTSPSRLDSASRAGPRYKIIKRKRT
ncbi:hypothetical protein N7513_001814 [Penicillium frequentans]|nr:hypothetical protein N7513_001814 [Penicillium glabrum]